MSAILARVTDLLQGEPLRAISYGAAIVVWLVVGIASQLGVVRFGPAITLQDALTDATAASAVLVGITETIRRYVYSPNTVKAIEAGVTPGVTVTATSPTGLGAPLPPANTGQRP